jgi:hypothetical protein
MGSILLTIIIICAGAMAVAWIYVQLKNYIIPDFKLLIKRFRKRIKDAKDK